MATRAKAREVIIGMLYAYNEGNTDIGKFAEELFEEHHIRNRQREFALFLFEGTIKHLAQIDDIIKSLLKEWHFKRIGEIEKAILELGIFELRYSDTDRAVVIDEAVRLAKHFCDDKAPRFINGVLDAFESDKSKKRQHSHKHHESSPKDE